MRRMKDETEPRGRRQFTAELHCCTSFVAVTTWHRKQAIPVLNVSGAEVDTSHRPYPSLSRCDRERGRQSNRHPPGIYTRLLARSHRACVVRRGHPILRRRWTLDAYIGLAHLLIGPPPPPDRAPPRLRRGRDPRACARGYQD
jgi:DNA-binding transcriptional LysR family regulator